MNKGFLFKLFYLFFAFTVVNFAQAPVIVIEPQNRGVIEGQTASFFIQATGDSLSYQWYKNDILISGANDSNYTTPATVLSDNLSKYKCVVTNSYGSDTSNAATLFVTASGSRVTEGLILLYNFNEAGGDTVLDNSGYGTPLGMKIFNTSAVSWTPKGLATNDKAFIRSNNATKVIDASTATNEVTVEAWVVPALSSQAPLSRIVTLGQGYNTQNYAIMQSGDSYVVRMRSTEPLPSDIGEGIATAPGTVTTQLTHLLFTRRSDGISYFYINGNIAFVDTGGGDFSNWFSTNRFQIANDFGDGPWLGTYYLVSVYERSLDQPEVLANYNYGVDNDKKPAIIFQPQDLGLIVGQPATFSVKYVGDPSTIVWRKNGIDIVGANSDSYTIPSVSISDNLDEYSCVITNSFGSDTSRNAKLNVTALNSRVSNGQLALYTFQENGGTVINDVAGYDPFNLDILTPGAVTWKPYGLFVNSPAVIRSALPATKIIDSVKSKNEFTFETWVKPEDLLQTPATIATLSSLGGPSFVNFVMNQDVNRLQTWFRTTTAPSSGLFLQTSPGTLGDSLLHIVYTFNNKEISKIYINGNLVTDSYMFGKLSNWNSSFYLRLADQFAVLSSFKGFYNLVSFYKRALSPSEINHNFTLGPINVDVKNPSNLTAQVTQIGKVNLAWDDSSNNEDGFILERKYGSFDFTVIDSLFPNTTTYVDSTVLDTTNYTYRVKAYNLLKQSGYSNTASVTTPLSTLAAPSSFTAALSQTFLNHVELSWQDNSPNEDGFIIERRVEGTKGAFTPIDSVGANVTAYVDSLVADTTTYTYRVQAYNQFLLSAYSDTASVTTLLSTLAAPSSFTAALSQTSLNHVELSWQDNSPNEDGFIIERRVEGTKGAFTPIDSVGANVTAYVDSLVADTTTYTYRVQAYNQFLLSAYSDTASVTTLLSTLAAPSSFTAALSQTSLNHVELSWQDNSPNEDGFIIERRVEGTKGAFTPIDSVGANVTAYVDSLVADTTTYTYRVQAYNQFLLSAYSDTASVTTLLSTLAAPSSFTAALSQTFLNHVELSWQDNSPNEDGFIIERRVEGTKGAFTPIDSVGANVTAYVDSLVADTTTYTYRVQAYNQFLLSAYSDTASVTTLLSTLAAPSSFTAALSQTSLNHVELSWQDNSPNEDGFIIERRVEGTKGAFTPIDSVGANVTAYVDSLVADTTTYTYRVQAYNQFLLSAYSDTASVTTLLSTLAAPTFLSAQLFGLDSQYVQLNWVDNSSNELGFIIERKDGNISSPNPFAVIDSVGMNMTVYVDTTVIFDSIYTYRVYAYNQFLVSAYSNLTDIRVPVELISFTAQVINGQVTLKWETATETNNSGFTVQRSKDNIKFTDLAFIKGKGTTTTQSSYNYTDKSILTGKYYYRLKQVDYSGAFTYSNTLEVDLGLPKDYSLYQNFPNPFNPSTTIRFALPVNSKVNLKLYNALGQEVANILNTELEAGIHQTVFDASQLSSGVYFYMLKVQGENGSNFTSTKRMVLIK